jgi:putative FmdB family regulatory protein
MRALARYLVGELAVPLYEYQCAACGQRFEVIQKFSDKPVKKCAKCGKSGKVERLVSSPAIQFKGTGWYITDYARKGSSPSTSDGKDKSESAKETSPGSTDTSATASSSKDSPATPSKTAKKPKSD